MAAPEVRLGEDVRFGEDVRLREAGPADAFALSTLGAATLLETFAGILPASALLWFCRNGHSLEKVTHALKQPATRAWLAEAFPGGAPVGYAMLTAPDFAADIPQQESIELKRIYLFSRFHGSGAGQQLMQAAIQSAKTSGYKRLLLGVYGKNERALAFYRRNGFTIAGTRRFTLGEHTFDDFVLTRTL